MVFKKSPRNCWILLKPVDFSTNCLVTFSILFASKFLLTLRLTLAKIGLKYFFSNLRGEQQRFQKTIDL